jgi:hypothetical protein
MRARLLIGTSLAVCMIAACGGTEESASDDSPGGGSGFGVLDDGGTGIGVGITDASFFDDGGVTVFADAGFDGDGGRRHRDGGVGGHDGGFEFDGGGFFDGGIGPTDAGVSPPPPEDDGGPVGPRDAGLSGPLLRDANGVVLGEIISIQSEGAVFTIVTSNDYIVDINFDGTFLQQAFLYSATNCGGTAYLQGSTETGELLGNTVVYSSSRGSLMIPSGPLTSGAESSIPVSWASVGDPCQNNASTGFYGWPLVATTAANVGLPDVIAAPLSYP